MLSSGLEPGRVSLRKQLFVICLFFFPEFRNTSTNSSKADLLTHCISFISPVIMYVYKNVKTNICDYTRIMSRTAKHLFFIDESVF